ncbi:MAG: thiamine-phosphate kinase [Gammaproteobacteria bacterium]
MTLTELDIIAGFRAHRGAVRGDVELGIGDDGAVLIPSPDARLIAVVDSLVAGVHFPTGLPACFVGHRALAVNLSDMAAMGGAPAWATLSLTLPSPDPAWLADFREGFFAIADDWNVALVGGDTTRGPLTVSVQLLGQTEPGGWLARAGAAPGDSVFVTGTLGDAAAGLAILQAGGGEPVAGAAAELVERFRRPRPRVAEGRSLAGLASAAIDISDGFAADLGKLVTASGAGAVIELESLPLSAALRAGHNANRAWQLALEGGDDYELCFTVPPGREDALAGVVAEWQCGCTRVGEIVAAAGVRCVDMQGRSFPVAGGYDHFAA